MSFLKKSKELTYHVLINPEKRKGFIYLIDDYFITILIILNVIGIILETYPAIRHQYYNYFNIFDILSVAAFTVEYLSRLWIADLVYSTKGKIVARLKYIVSPFGIVDLLAILPFYLPMVFEFDLRILRILRLFRLFRVLKLAHYATSLTLIAKVIKSKKEELLITFFVAFIMLLLSSNIMYHIESESQPDKFTSIFSAFWWSIATLTTIGYGDIYPITGWGQLLAAITALFGIGLIAIPTGIISSGFVEELSKRKLKEKEIIEFKYCPHCGKKLKN